VPPDAARLARFPKSDKIRYWIRHYGFRFAFRSMNMGFPAACISFPANELGKKIRKKGKKT
jgi:hypothetical protein